MQTVVDVKFLTVEWMLADRYSYPNEARNNQAGLKNALDELRTKISENLKLGWAMKGDVSYQQRDGTYHLVQTMVKHEKIKEGDLLTL